MILSFLSVLVIHFDRYIYGSIYWGMYSYIFSIALSFFALSYLFKYQSKITIKNIISEGKISKFTGGLIAKLIKGRIKKITVKSEEGKVLAKRINDLQIHIQEVDNFLQQQIPGRKDGKSYEDLFKERGV